MSEAQEPTLDELYMRHRQAALRVVRRVLGDPHEAEDVVQEVFARLWARPGRFEGRSSWSTWLYRVLVNRSINALRARRGAPPLPQPERPATPEELAVSNQMRELFARALDDLGGRHREVVWLREVRGLSYPEIAARLGIPEGTVKSALHRGRSRAFERMLEWGADGAG